MVSGPPHERRIVGRVHRQLSVAAPLVFVWSATLVALSLARSQGLVPIDELFLDPSTLAGSP